MEKLSKEEKRKGATGGHVLSLERAAGQHTQSDNTQVVGVAGDYCAYECLSVCGKAASTSGSDWYYVRVLTRICARFVLDPEILTSYESGHNKAVVLKTFVRNVREVRDNSSSFNCTNV